VTFAVLFLFSSENEASEIFPAPSYFMLFYQGHDSIKEQTKELIPALFF
jgi:hypothetical protein